MSMFELYANRFSPAVNTTTDFIPISETQQQQLTYPFGGQRLVYSVHMAELLLNFSNWNEIGWDAYSGADFLISLICNNRKRSSPQETQK